MSALSSRTGDDSFNGPAQIAPTPWTGGHVVEALDSNAGQLVPFDLGSRGTRPRGAATYAKSASGSVVFVASKDRPVTCMFRPMHHDAVLAWRQG